MNMQSPIIQNMMQQPYTGPPTGGYDINPSTRYQANFMPMPVPNNYNQMNMNNIPQPNIGQFGTLGYNPGIQSFDPSMMGATQYNRNGYYNPYTIAQPAPIQDQTVIQPGWNPSNSDILMSEELEKKSEELAKRIANELEEENQRQQELMSSNPYNYFGYRNTGYMNPYFKSKFDKMQYELEMEAKQNRIEFNKKLSKAARGYLGYDTSDEVLNDIYDSKEINIPYQSVQVDWNYQRLCNCTVDVVQQQKDTFNRANNAISQEHNMIINRDADLNTYLSSAGELLALDAQEEVLKQKRDKKKLYKQDGTFNSYIDKQLAIRDGNPVNAFNSIFPNLNTNSSFLDDGTLSIKYPDFNKVKNENESSYEENRMKFIQSIYNPEV